jgi:Uncharacterized membrane protein
VWSALRDALVDKWRYMAVATGWFALWAVAGFVSFDALWAQRPDVVDSLFARLRELAEAIADRQSWAYFFGTILLNNLIVAASTVGLGIFFGLFPLAALAANGLVIGFFLRMLARQGEDPIAWFLAGILPHGVLEFPALFLAGAFGLALGVRSVQLLGGLVSPAVRQKAFDRFARDLRQLPAVVTAIVVLLLGAALIETTITPLVVDWFQLR